jgi:hypothetical protein
VRRRRIRRELIALGFPPHTPTDATRATVRIHAFNRMPEQTIADIIGVDLTVLRYWYGRELGFSEAEILATAAANMLELAAQRIDLGVAFRANETLLRTRLPAWREPKPVEAGETGEVKPAVNLTLKEVERELAKLKGPGDRPPDAAAAPREDPVSGPRKPH